MLWTSHTGAAFRPEASIDSDWHIQVNKLHSIWRQNLETKSQRRRSKAGHMCAPHAALKTAVGVDWGLFCWREHDHEVDGIIKLGQCQVLSPNAVQLVYLDVPVRIYAGFWSESCASVGCPSEVLLVLPLTRNTSPQHCVILRTHRQTVRKAHLQDSRLDTQRLSHHLPSSEIKFTERSSRYPRPFP
ncbi:hypothetical protein Pelo_18660 [Pelomyxa schiedti]|nr:hypothetical protein Pelo_18660 [Pelomyxa schiedti]